MNHRLEGVVLRRPEPRDLDALYVQKNDPAVASLLGGFSTGYSRSDLEQWLEFHRKQKDEVLWAVAEEASDRFLGHVGLYQIDHRVRSAEFAIMLGDLSVWGKGIGRACTRFVVEYGFDQLNLNRIHLSVLSTNERAMGLYTRMGFLEEGRLRQAQYKDGRYVDVVVMGLLREEYARA